MARAALVALAALVLWASLPPEVCGAVCAQLARLASAAPHCAEHAAPPAHDECPGCEESLAVAGPGSPTGPEGSLPRPLATLAAWRDGAAPARAHGGPPRAPPDLLQSPYRSVRPPLLS